MPRCTARNRLKKFALTPWSVDQWRPHDYELHTGFSGQRAERLLGLQLGKRIGIGGSRNIQLGEWLPQRLLAIDLDGTNENKAPGTQPGCLARQGYGEIEIDPAIFCKGIR
ncbi:hypothetical protein SSTU70S_04059 [Stutzerimonas stutzeri]